MHADLRYPTIRIARRVIVVEGPASGLTSLQVSIRSMSMLSVDNGSRMFCARSDIALVKVWKRLVILQTASNVT